jgi:hypothetical protein
VEQYIKSAERKIKAADQVKHHCLAKLFFRNPKQREADSIHLHETGLIRNDQVIQAEMKAY